MTSRVSILALSALLWCHIAVAQDFRLLEAPAIAMPAPVDSNSPCFWFGDKLFQFNSVGWPMRLSVASSHLDLWETQEVDTAEMSDMAIWMEAVWLDEDGTLFGWYHHEPQQPYAGTTLTMPRIGAAISFDQGQTFHDLGIILETSDLPDLSAKNGYFAGGHGDFSVILDRERRHFYIFFGNYGGDPATQGVCVARMAYEDRYNPSGKVYKYCQGNWEQPGLGGAVTPIFPVQKTWAARAPNAFWGPSVHWNTYLNRFVMVLNRTTGVPAWSQEGVYITFCDDITRPEAWQAPRKILDSSELPDGVSMYAQITGTEKGETDTLAGRVARLWVSGVSVWEIEFGAATGFGDDTTDDELPLPILIAPGPVPGF